MLVVRKPIKNMIIVRLNPGDDVLESLNKAVKENDIKNAVILSAFGSVRNHHYHVVVTRDFPPKDEFIKEDKPSDILDFSGCIINGRVHIHVTQSDPTGAYGGHLESGVQANTFLSIFLAELDYDLDKLDSPGKIEELRGSV